MANRQDEPLTRREMIEALRTLAREYTNGPPEFQRISDVLKELAKALS